MPRIFSAEAEKALGTGKAPLFKSSTKLIFDKKERAAMTAFMYGGRPEGFEFGRRKDGVAALADTDVALAQL